MDFNLHNYRASLGGHLFFIEVVRLQRKINGYKLFFTPTNILL